jgi:diguanylate cyclase (GGDEF)-like protein
VRRRPHAESGEEALTATRQPGAGLRRQPGAAAPRAGESALSSPDACPACGRPPCDAVTGLDDRWTWARQAPTYLRHIVNRGGAAAVLVVDVDHFKAVNTEYGHPAGDRVLRAMGATARHVTRAGDLVCRAGGGADEILMLLADAGANTATKVASDLRAAVGRLAIEAPTRRGTRILDGLSVSVGYCVYDPALLDPVDRRAVPDLDQLVLAADDALLSVQAAGGGVRPVYWGVSDLARLRFGHDQCD